MADIKKAYELLSNGKKIRRQAWDEDKFISYDAKFSLSKSDIFANDWELWKDKTPVLFNDSDEDLHRYLQKFESVFAPMIDYKSKCLEKEWKDNPPKFNQEDVDSFIFYMDEFWDRYKQMVFKKED